MPRRFAHVFPARRLVALLAFFCAAGIVGAAVAPAATELGLPPLRVFSPRDYDAHEQVWACVEGPAGTLVFGNYDKVLEFDGLNWRSIDIPGAVFVRGLTIDAGGTIYVAGVNELGRLRPGFDGRLTYESLRSRVPPELSDLGAFWCVHALPDGVYFQSNAAVLRWAGGKFDVWPMHETKTVLSYKLGDRLLVTRPGGWVTPKPGSTWEPIGAPALATAFPGVPRFFLPEAGGGWLVGSGSNGLFHFDGTLLTPLPTPADDFLKTQKLYSGLRLPDGRLVLCTLQGGAVVLGADLQPRLFLNESSGMPTSTVIVSALDHRGVVWFGTDQGIVRAELNSPVSWFHSANGLGRAGVNDLGRWHDRLFVLNARGWLTLQPPTTGPGNARFELRRDFADKPNCYAPVGDNHLVGALGGLWWLTPDRVEKIDSPTNVRDLAVLKAQPGRVLGAHLNGVASWRRDGDGWRYERDLPQPRGEFNSLLEAPNGDVWVGTAKDGAWRLHWPRHDGPAEVKLFGEDAGLPLGHARTFIKNIGGAPLFITGTGIYRFDDATQRFTPETRYGRLPDEGAAGARTVALDDRGGLWLEALLHGDDPQIGCVQGETWTPLAITNRSDLGVVDTLRFEKGDNGNDVLWIAGLRALLRVDLAAWRARPDPGPGATLIRAVATPAGRLLVPQNAPPTAAPLRLDNKQNSVRFTYATPGLAGETELRHETRLRGFVDGGEELSAAGERIFTNLPPGDYVFEARGRGADGRWSTPATFAFTVLAPWWQTRWALTVYGVALALAVYGIVRLRTRLLEREGARLGAVVAARTAELAQKNRELERLNLIEQDEKLAARLAGEKTRLELLRYQLNPHFLFNSLNSIRALVHANPAQADEMVTRLAEFCRWTLTRGSDELTTVAEEIDMLRTYLDIEKARWQEALIIRVEVEAAVLSRQLPQFLLLPLVENAIKYGGQTSRGTLGVEIVVRRDGAFLYCEVANTGRWIAPLPRPRATSTQIGLDNLRERLTRHYGPACTYEIDARQTGWVRVSLRLPERLTTPAPPRAPRDPFTPSP